MLFRKARERSEGSIRFYDYGSRFTKVLAVLIFIVCVFLIVIALFPIIWLFLGGFKETDEIRQTTSIIPQTFDFAKYGMTWTQLNFMRFYLNSIISVAGCVVCAVIFNGLMAYVLGILKPAGSRIIFALVMWSLLIPPTTSMVALYISIVKIGLTGTMFPLWFSFGAMAFYVILFKQYFESLPKEFLEAARLEGCTDFQVLVKIITPLSRPIIAVVTIFAVTAAWSDFLLPYLVLNQSEWKTVAVRLYEFNASATRATDVDMLRAAVFSVIPPIILFAIFQRQIIRGVQTGGIKE